MTGIKNIPYDIPIIISFGIFIGIIYLIAIHIFVPFITELRAFTRSIPATFSALQSAIPELEAAYHLSLLPAEAQGFIAKNDSRDRGIYIETCTIQFVSNIFFLPVQ